MVELFLNILHVILLILILNLNLICFYLNLNLNLYIFDIIFTYLVRKLHAGKLCVKMQNFCAIRGHTFSFFLINLNLSGLVFNYNTAIFYVVHRIFDVKDIADLYFHIFLNLIFDFCF